MKEFGHTNQVVAVAKKKYAGFHKIRLDHTGHWHISNKPFNFLFM